MEEASSKPFDVVKLYVDPVVDWVHSEALRTFHFTPIDEPLLEEAFSNDLFETRVVGELRVKVLASHVLLATKMSSSIIRLEGHKRVKDIADIYVLAWYSGLPFSEIRGVLSEVY